MDLEAVAQQPVGYGPVEIGGGFQGDPYRQILFLKKDRQTLKVLLLVGDPEGPGPARWPSDQNVMSSLGYVYRNQQVIPIRMRGGRHRHTPFMDDLAPSKDAMPMMI